MTRHDATYYRRLANAAQHWLPELVGQEPLYTWGVDLNVTADMIPELSTIGRNAFSIDGLGALGVLPGIVLGRRAAEAILHG
jgi:glycine/D-amino acid oxidase-like deaminating enzyme